MKFKFPQKFTLSNLLYNKKFAIALSIILAFSLWLGIAMIENPIRKQTFNDLGATVTLEGTAAEKLGLGIVSDVVSQRFSVTVEGKSSDVSKLKAEDFKLYASTVEVNSQGTYNLDIHVTNSKGNLDYDVISIEPSNIAVFVDFIDTKEFSVEPKLIGVSASDGLVAESPLVSDSQQTTITIKGPRSTINKIATVGAVKEVNSTLSTSQTFDTDIILYDENDKVLYHYTSDGAIYDANKNIVTNSYLSLSFTNVKVMQPISKQKTVVCESAFNNLPAGFTDADIKYTVNPSTITIIGAPEIIDGIDSIMLSPIDFRDVTPTSNSFEVSTTLPNGVKFLENIDSFIVDVDVSGYAEATFELKDIRWSGLADGLQANPPKALKNVKICGPESIIKQVKATDLYAFVNLENKTAGDYTVEVIIKSDVYDKIWQIGTYNISITLKE